MLTRNLRRASLEYMRTLAEIQARAIFSLTGNIYTARPLAIFTPLAILPPRTLSALLPGNKNLTRNLQNHRPNTHEPYASLTEKPIDKPNQNRRRHKNVFGTDLFKPTQTPIISYINNPPTVAQHWSK